MIIYVDKDYKCHTAPGDGLSAVDTDFFDGKAPDYIAGYRFVPEGQSWTREDGAAFAGEMISPWKDWNELDKIQREYERAQYGALIAQNDELLEAMAAMVEDVYQSDTEIIGG